MNKILNVALIGAGRIGAEPSDRLKGILPQGWLPLSHAEAIISNPHLKLVAICDSDAERLKRHQTYYKIEYAFSDYRTLIKEVKPDIISIATRTEGRTDIIKYAAENGVKGIYCEKPIARSLEECISAIEVCKKNNVKLQYGTTRRYMPIYREAKRIAASGELGSLVEIVVEYGCEKILWTHPHFSDLMIFFAGTTDIEYIQGNCLHDLPENNLIDSDPLVLNSFIKFSNNVYGSIKQANGSNIRMNFSKGNLVIHSDGEFIEIRKESTKRMIFDTMETIQPPSPLSGTQTGFQELVQNICAGPSPAISYDEIVAGFQILAGIVQSSLKDGIKVYPDQINKQLTITGRTGAYYA